MTLPAPDLIKRDSPFAPLAVRETQHKLDREALQGDGYALQAADGNTGLCDDLPMPYSFTWLVMKPLGGTPWATRTRA